MAPLHASQISNHQSPLVFSVTHTPQFLVFHTLIKYATISTQIAYSRGIQTPPLETAQVTTLKPEVFHILLALMDGERHGYAIMNDVAQRTGGEIKLLPGVLYRHLHRLLDGGLIDELDRRSIPEGTDERRRYYRVTDGGVAAARAETLRMAKLVEVAKGKDLLADAGS